MLKEHRTEKELISGRKEPTLLNHVLNLLFLGRQVNIVEPLLDLMRFDQQGILKYTAEAKELNDNIEDTCMCRVNDFLQLAL